MSSAAVVALICDSITPLRLPLSVAILLTAGIPPL